MSKLDTILDAGQQQLTLDDLLATLEAEIGPESHDDFTFRLDFQPGTEPVASVGHAERNGGLPCGMMWQVGKGQAVEDALIKSKAIFRRKFKCNPATVWAHPATANGEVSHDKRIGRGYLLLGPLPKMEV